MIVDLLNPNKQVCQLLDLIVSHNIKNIKFKKYVKITEQQFYSIPLPKKEVIKSCAGDYLYCITGSQTTTILKHCVQLLNADKCTNAIVYGPESVMDWHTNSDNIGYRTYYTYTIGKGIFRYKDPQSEQIVNSYDNAGWTVRRFKIDNNNPLWHTVWAEKLRFAFGFNSK